MPTHKNINNALLGVICTALVTFVANPVPIQAQAASAAAPGQNLLSNPGHEHPGVYFAGRGEINVTWSWVPFWEEPPAGTDLRDQNYRTPEFRPVFAHEYPYRVHSGSGSDHWFNYFALNKAAGIMQVVENLPVGKPVRFSTWVELWSSNENLDPPRSTRDGNMLIRVCIQTDGGPRNMQSDALKCSDWTQPYDRWVQIAVDAVPTSSSVIALIQSTASLPVEHNDAYVDDSCFEVLPAANAKGICMEAGYIPTGSKVDAQPAPVSQAPLKPVAVPTGSSPLAAVVSAGINIRATPSMTATVTGAAQRGNVLSITGKSADGKWYRVIKTASVYGWAYASLLLPNQAAKDVAVVK